MTSIETIIRKIKLEPKQLIAMINATGTTSTKELAISKLFPFFKSMSVKDLIDFYEPAKDYYLQKAVVLQLITRWSTYNPEQLIKIGKKYNKEFIWKSIFESTHFLEWLQNKSRRYIYALGNAINTQEIWLVMFRMNKLSFDQMVSAINQSEWFSNLIENVCDWQIPNRHTELTTPKLIELGVSLNDFVVWEAILNTHRLSAPKLIEVNRLTDNKFLDIIFFLLQKKHNGLSTKQLEMWFDKTINDEVAVAIIKTNRLSKKKIVEIFNETKRQHDAYEVRKACIESGKISLSQMIEIRYENNSRNVISIIASGLVDTQLSKLSLKKLIELTRSVSFEDKALARVSKFLLPKLEKNHNLDQLIKIGEETCAWPILIELIKPHLAIMDKDKLIAIGCKADNNNIWKVIYDELKKRE